MEPARRLRYLRAAQAFLIAWSTMWITVGIASLFGAVVDAGYARILSWLGVIGMHSYFLHLAVRDWPETSAHLAAARELRDERLRRAQD